MMLTYISLYNLTHLPLIHSAAGLSTSSLSLDDDMENFKDILPFFLSAIDAGVSLSFFDAIVAIILYMKMIDDICKVSMSIQGYIVYYGVVNEVILDY